MLSFRHKRLVLRLVAIISIQMMIKAFDTSFGNIFELTNRGLSFSFFFISLWLVVWYLADLLHLWLKNVKKTYNLLIHLSFGFGAAVLTNIIYRYGDIYFFNNEDIWEDIVLINPELSISLLLFYLLFYSINEYIQSNNKIKEEAIKTEQLEKENILSQYKLLKAHIEPHFLFNSLSILSSIIHSDTELAGQFLDKLSKTLRYLIEKSEQVLVPAREEIELVENYYFLLETRFLDSLQLKMRFSMEELDSLYLPPTALQLLIENAVKHNKQSEEQALVIELSITNSHISVANNLNKKVNQNSTGTGLKNLNKRYQFLSKKEIKVVETEAQFIVQLPLLSKEEYESINH